MKRIDSIIRPHQLDEVKSRLNSIGVQGITVAEVRGFGRQKGHTEVYRGTEYAVEFLPKLQITILASDELVPRILEAITEGARTGKIGDGKIFVTPLEEVVRILLFGWMGFNPGSTLGATDLRISVVAINTNLAAIAGSATAMLVWYFMFGKPDITMACNGMLAGLVAITAPCAFVSPTSATIIGVIAGVNWTTDLLIGYPMSVFH